MSSFEPPDTSMTAEQEAIAGSLTAEMVARIDGALLSHARVTPRKVAMLVGLAMSDPQVRVPGLPDAYYAIRVKALVARGALLSFGNLDYMRYSEVRVP
jgi:hypothetical protein